MPSGTETPQLLHVLVASSLNHEFSLPRSIYDQLLHQANVTVRTLLGSTTASSPFPSALEKSPLTSHTAKRIEPTYWADALPDELARWADTLILAPIDADSLARMLHGIADTPLLQLLRGWDVSKKILLIPGMSTSMWEHPMTKRQLSKIRRKWNWIRVLPPLLWTFEERCRKVLPWEGLEETKDAVQTQIDLMTIGHGVDTDMADVPSFTDTSEPKLSCLPPELWSMVLDFTGDWELATALNVHTMLPVPQEWKQAVSKAGPQTPMEKLEWAILTGTMRDISATFEQQSPKRLSKLCIKLIMRFGMVPLLNYLETFHKDLFWRTFGQGFLPDKASSVFGRVEILHYWHTSPTFMKKDYSTEAIDGASKLGFVHVLDWWQKSGLPLRFTEAALEQASSHGQIQVLEWWKNMIGLHRIGNATSNDTEPSSSSNGPLRLKVGKSISYATQAGSLSALRWWATSGVPFQYEETVAKLASTHGHVPLLTYWKSLRGEKMIFDNQVLVGATKMGHVDVLEWWKCSGLRVEYKTCDIEEALEDGVEGFKGEQVRRWWARNGLNLGVGTSEWMKTKVLI